MRRPNKIICSLCASKTLFALSAHINHSSRHNITIEKHIRLNGKTFTFMCTLNHWRDVLFFFVWHQIKSYHIKFSNCGYCSIQFWHEFTCSCSIPLLLRWRCNLSIHLRKWISITIVLKINVMHSPEL